MQSRTKNIKKRSESKESPVFFSLGILFIACISLAYFYIPREASALTTAETTDAITSEVGAQNTAALYREVSPQTVTGLSNRVGINKVTGAIRAAGAGNFGQAVRRIGVEPITRVFEETTGVHVGGFINQSSVDTVVRIFGSPNRINQNLVGSATGKLLQHVGVSGVSNTVVKTGGRRFGDFLGQSSCLSIAGGGCSQTQLNTGGLENVGQTILGSGGTNVGQLINVLGGNRAGSFITGAGGTLASRTLNTLGPSGIQNAVLNLGSVSAVTDVLRSGGVGALSSIIDSSNKNPCTSAESIPTGDAGALGEDAGGTYVPVKDFTTETNTGLIRQDTVKIRQDTVKVSLFLFDLCMKEYEYDSTVQHEWRTVIDRFVNKTLQWINTAYKNNPVYVTNPHVYYRQVELGVSKAMIKDIRESNIDPDIKRIMERTLESQQIDKVFPEHIAERFTGNNENIWENNKDFTWGAWIEGSMNTGNNLYDIASVVQQEYEARRRSALEVEREKLAWGRGFFPYETCGMKVFSQDESDIRTCSTLTPGSILQDLTTLVLSSALRQMENADEYEEWISENAFIAMNQTLWPTGLRFVSSGEAGVISPASAEQNIDFTERLRDVSGGETSREKSNFYFDAGEVSNFDF